MSNRQFTKAAPEHHYESLVRLAAIGDIHCTERSQKVMNNMFKDAHLRSEVLLLCGDITDTGRPSELTVVLNSLKPCIAEGLTVVSILGEHDYHNQQMEELIGMMRAAGIKALYEDENVYIYKNKVGFVGVKGYWGGFAPHFLPGIGEANSKHLVTETLEDVRRLSRGLQSLPIGVHKVAMLHYAPIRDTLKGEPPEMYTTLGCEWLALPLEEDEVSLCFHGHAHFGSYSGITKKGTPVYNVALPVLRRQKLPIPNLHLV